MSDEQKAKISKANKGHKGPDPEEQRKRSLAYWATPGYRENQVVKQKRRWSDPEYRNKMMAIHHSPERIEKAKEAVRINRYGNYFGAGESEEHINSVRRGIKMRVFTEEDRARSRRCILSFIESPSFKEWRANKNKEIRQSDEGRDTQSRISKKNVAR